MKRKKVAVERTPAPAASAQAAPQGEAGIGHIIERPDGFYWQPSGRGGEHGPFTTRAEAEDAMQSGPGELETESLQEAESELGISEWIDPDTGVPAEDSVPRLEDH